MSSNHPPILSNLDNVFDALQDDPATANFAEILKALCSEFKSYLISMHDSTHSIVSALRNDVQKLHYIVSEANGDHDSNNALRHEPMVEYRLVEQTDMDLITQLKPTGVVKKFKQAGPPWDTVRAITLRGRSLFIFVSTEDAAQQIRDRGHEIGEILSVSVGCYVVVPEYLVSVFSDAMGEAEFKDVASFLEAWSKENDVTFIKGSWTYGKLVLSLSRVEDALRLCSGSIVLSGNMGWAK